MSDKRYQVFLSSTYADLKDERRKVIQALMEMDCIPAGMELFPAADEEQFTFIKSVINDCDYYILIIGGRYGSTTPDGLSYTEKEYEYAKSRGIKVLSFLHENPEDIALSKSESDPARRLQLNNFRTRVMEATLVRQWKIADELPGLVALSLAKTIKSHPAVGWVRADQLANTQALQELNELRKLNKEIEARNKALSLQINSFQPKIQNLASLDDIFKITGTRTRYGYAAESQWSLTPSWRELFGLLSPHILAQPVEDVMSHSFSVIIKEIYKRHFTDQDNYINWSLPDIFYQTVKVQLMALGLVEVSMRGTVKGGLALFWSLTPSGRAAMLEISTVKSIR